MIKSFLVIQKLRNGLKLNTATTLSPRVRKYFQSLQYEQIWRRDLIIMCLGHANAITTIFCRKAMCARDLMSQTNHFLFRYRKHNSYEKICHHTLTKTALDHSSENHLDYRLVPYKQPEYALCIPQLPPIPP